MKKSRENDQARLQHMLDHARLACQFAEGRTRDDIDSDDQFRLALDRAVEIVGEAACKISDELQAETPEIPWREIKGIRLIIAHRYDEIDHDVLWETVTEHIPPLIGQLEAIVGPEV
ncbi:MAG: DUF86 domain-containing protein [Chloroflexota bacterium]|nr:DUF86 domain-containing protein [Chloroflexota bacterium]MDE2908885.1 DUF86 domain-containing protein [Chloroflexota bacterium]